MCRRIEPIFYPQYKKHRMCATFIICVILGGALSQLADHPNKTTLLIGVLFGCFSGLTLSMISQHLIEDCYYKWFPGPGEKDFSLDENAMEGKQSHDGPR